jgi:AcrR family transcriptional regulator
VAVTTARIEPVVAVRRRPKDRKAQIARASAESFSSLGYHAVSMEAIAAKVGISAPALYRHYASKYDLFRGAVLALGQQLVDCTDFADAEPAEAADPAAHGNSADPDLVAPVDALVGVAQRDRQYR